MVRDEYLFEAFQICKIHKASSPSYIKYFPDYQRDLLRLADEINARTYRPSTSIAFVVTKPKLREVFAAGFRDPCHGGASLCCFRGADKNHITAGAGPLLRRPDHPGRRYHHTGLYEIRCAVFYLTAAGISMEVIRIEKKESRKLRS